MGNTPRQQLQMLWPEHLLDSPPEPVLPAGYELRTKAGYEATMRQLQNVIDPEHVLVIHVNDSLKPLGSRIDRHAHIGEGQLGLKAFANLVNDPRFATVPMIIETPGGPKKDKVNLRRLRKLVTVK